MHVITVHVYRANWLHLSMFVCIVCKDSFNWIISSYLVESVPSFIALEANQLQYTSSSNDNNYYLYDVIDSSLTIRCTFNAASNAISELKANSFWSFDLLNDTIDRQLQTEDFGLVINTNTTLTVETSVGNVSMVFVPGDSLTFTPVFPPELNGRYVCGVRNINFAVVDDVILAITTGKKDA